MMKLSEQGLLNAKTNRKLDLACQISSTVLNSKEKYCVLDKWLVQILYLGQS